MRSTDITHGQDRTYLSEEPEGLEGPVEGKGVEEQRVGMRRQGSVKGPDVVHFYRVMMSETTYYY